MRAPRILVGRLPPGITEAALTVILTGDGRRVRSLRIGRQSDPPGAHAFAEMGSIADAVHAVLALDGRVLSTGERLHVTEAAPRLVSDPTPR
jgi:hypothetical protein